MLARLRTDGHDGEAGFLLVEVLAAIVVLAVGVIALMGVFDSSRRLTNTSEKVNVLSQAAQQELQQILSLTYTQAALSSNPTCTTGTHRPTDYVTGCTAGPFYYKYDGTNTEKVIVDTTNGQVAPTVSGSTPSPTGGNRLTWTLYNYITATSDPQCSSCTTGSSGENFKRVTVVAYFSTGPTVTSTNTPVVVSSFAINPCATSSGFSCTVQ
jgi:Tfp pilus assembly protein PilV